MTVFTANIITLKHQHLAATTKKYVWPFAYVLVAAAGLHNYIEWGSINFVLGVIALFFCSRLSAPTVGSYKYALFCIAFIVANFFIPVKTLLYASTVCGILFYTENTLGACNRIVLLIAAFMCPICQYAIEIFGFPIRLELTYWAAKLLYYTGANTVAQGNIILINGNEFSVDPACMGLSMMITSVLAGIIIIRILEQKTNKQISWFWLCLLITAFLLLNVLANLIRIIGLVLLKIPADNVFHEGVGLLCMVVYVIIPSTFLVQFCVKKFGTVEEIKTPSYRFANTKKFAYINYLLIFLIAFSSFKIYQITNSVSIRKSHAIAISGYAATALPNDVIKLISKKELVYIKHILGFYSSDHNPSICWRGSGYSFKKICINNINGTDVYCAVLEKGNEQLHTAWWYDNGLQPTISQLSWRGNELLSGTPYSIVNITTSSQKELNEAVAKALLNKTFNPAITAR